ncbi:MAG TPA: hypothetical protein VKA31_00355 [Mariprofundaceae bacterium]|nr:hypothetical protein [Mariprofundaceae bacterium]
MTKVNRVEFNESTVCVWFGESYAEIRKRPDRYGIYIPAIHNSSEEACGWFDEPFPWPRSQEEATAFASIAVDEIIDCYGYGSWLE